MEELRRDLISNEMNKQVMQEARITSKSVVFRHLPPYQQESILRAEAAEAAKAAQEAQKRDAEREQYKQLFGDEDDDDVPLAMVLQRLEKVREINNARPSKREEDEEARVSRFRHRQGVAMKKNNAIRTRHEENDAVLFKAEHSDEDAVRAAGVVDVKPKKKIRRVPDATSATKEKIVNDSLDTFEEDDEDEDAYNQYLLAHPPAPRPRRQAAAENPYLRSESSDSGSSSGPSSMSVSTSSSSEFELGKRRTTEQIWGDSTYKTTDMEVDMLIDEADLNFVTTKRKVEPKKKMILKKR